MFEIMEKLYLSKSCLKMAGVGRMHPPHPPLPALITMSLITTVHQPADLASV